MGASRSCDTRRPAPARDVVGVVAVSDDAFPKQEDIEQAILDQELNNFDHIGKIFTEILAERVHQTEKFGDREDLPSLDPTLFIRLAAQMNTEVASTQAAERYEIPTAKRAKHLRERAAKPSWVHVVVEELAESVEAACRFGDGPLLRAEIIQVAASCVAWLENIDRRA